MTLLNLETVAINTYRESARASQRGFKRLQRRIDTRDKRIAFLENFIESRQLTGELEAVEQRAREEKRAEYMAKDL